MRVTKRQLRRIIKEEKQKLLAEVRIRRAVRQILQEKTFRSDRVTWEFNDDTMEDEWRIAQADNPNKVETRGSGMKSLEAAQYAARDAGDEGLYQNFNDVIDQYHTSNW
jgi:hypothetical protein